MVGRIYIYEKFSLAFFSAVRYYHIAITETKYKDISIILKYCNGTCDSSVLGFFATGEVKEENEQIRRDVLM